MSEELIADCVLTQITPSSLLFTAPDTIVYEVFSPTPIQSDNTFIKGDLLDLHSKAIIHYDSVEDMVTKVHVKKRVARKPPNEEFALPVVGFSSKRFPLSLYTKSYRVDQVTASTLQILEAKFPVCRTVTEERGFYVALGVGLLEVMARNEARIDWFQQESRGEGWLEGFFHDGNRLDWLESQGTSEEFRNQLSEKIRRMILEYISSNRAQLGQSADNLIKEHSHVWTVDASQMCLFAAKKLRVEVVRILLGPNGSDSHKYKGDDNPQSTAKCPKVYLLEDANRRFFLLNSRRQLCIEGFDLISSKRCLKGVEPTDLVFFQTEPAAASLSTLEQELQSAEVRSQALVQAIVYFHNFLTASIRAAARWTLLISGTLFKDGEMMNRLREGVNKLREHLPQSDAFSSLFSSFIDVHSVFNSCSKCGEQSFVLLDLNCHQFCNTCFRVCLMSSLRKRVSSFNCPKVGCNKVKSKDTIRAVIGSKQYQQIEQEAGISIATQDLECSKCRRVGRSTEVYDLYCQCNLCLPCAVDLVRFKNNCPCGKEVPAEVVAFVEQGRMRCCKCGVEKNLKNHFAKTPCIGHWLCKPCAALLLNDVRVVCPACDVVFTQPERSNLGLSLFSAECSICKVQQASVETLDTTCSCIVCFDCVTRSGQPPWLCPSCNTESLTQRGRDKIIMLRKGASIRQLIAK